MNRESVIMKIVTRAFNYIHYDVYIIFLFLFVFCVGLWSGHLLTEKHCVNLDDLAEKIDAIVQSHEAKYLLRNEVKK